MSCEFDRAGQEVDQYLDKSAGIQHHPIDMQVSIRIFNEQVIFDVGPLHVQLVNLRCVADGLSGSNLI